MPGSVAQPLILAALHSAARQQGRQIGQKPRQPAPRVNRRGRVSALSAASALQCSAPIQINLDDAAALIPDYQLGEEVSPPPPRTCQRLTKLCVSPAHARLSWLNVDDAFDVYTATVASCSAKLPRLPLCLLHLTRFFCMAARAEVRPACMLSLLAFAFCPSTMALVSLSRRLGAAALQWFCAASVEAPPTRLRLKAPIAGAWQQRSFPAMCTADCQRSRQP